MPEEEIQNTKNWLEKIKPFFESKYLLKKRMVVAFLIIFFLAVAYIYVHLPPSDFPKGEIVSVKAGESLQEITNTLYERNVIKFPFVFRTTVILLGGEKKVIAGDYLLDKVEGPADLAFRLIHGKFHLDVVKVTIPEGWNIFQIADFLAKNLTKFDKSKFLNLAKGKEGYLFPETYFISPVSKPEYVIDIMSKTFNEKTKNIQGLSTTTYKFKDVIIMASILEGEARTTESRKIISGILWKRLSLGIPLQVDATFSYINGKGTEELTLDDLKINSPYNTYLYKGLPPAPISNPGVDAIQAAINPIETKYLYFLTDKNGVMHYALTFDEHKKNKAKYLK